MSPDGLRRKPLLHLRCGALAREATQALLLATPGGDGLYLLSRIKSTPATMGIPVVVCSGKVSDARDRAPVERELRGRGQAADFFTNLYLSKGCWTRYGDMPASPSS